ncbi:Xaa-Pro peptidase family protein [Salipiger sp. P9]|uniref:M24 family metallopeptidase n=1 Tax=Salipiger pentaromativorans TaxID=2943193 RepID=UPI0021584CEF|nr:Xaa-Pro peptidase family protein [Salipiger pentaromativorans]MCR8548870.1 Xaa-Pro peptidase family protein [Salipiger pentaromativorans]
MTSTQACERLLDGFEPDFDFEAAPPIPPAEFAERIERLRREAIVAEHDAIVVNANAGNGFSVTNGFLRYLCDWAREGVLVIPTDPSKGMHLFSFYTENVILPPGGEPLGVEAIWQISPFSLEYGGRSGNRHRSTVGAVKTRLAELGCARGSIAVIGDESSGWVWAGLREELPGAKYTDETRMVQRMQSILSLNERAQVRSAAQLADIGYQAACHVTRPGVSDYEIYAAFTFAQMARGGESGDGYQIGINQWGTACGKPYGHRVREGDLINMYVSAVSYHGYWAQTARMMAVGEITARQEETLEMCTDAVRRAEKLIRPGVPFKDLHAAAFSAYIEHGYLKDDVTATMPYNWDAMADGSPRLVPAQYVPNADYEAQGRRLDHVYPATRGPHNPNLGHSVGSFGNPKFNVTSHNTARAEPGMVFVLHAQWLDPLSDGANIGDCYLITEDGYENLSCHSSLETFRVPA